MSRISVEDENVIVVIDPKKELSPEEESILEALGSIQLIAVKSKEKRKETIQILSKCVKDILALHTDETTIEMSDFDQYR
tara:strand:- start:1127 stop:1366 length:240 start_codon:yes stop_codon:yes gene_type:complete